MAEAEVGNDVYEECPTVKRELDECSMLVHSYLGWDNVAKGSCTSKIRQYIF